MPKADDLEASGSQAGSEGETQLLESFDSYSVSQDNSVDCRDRLVLTVTTSDWDVLRLLGEDNDLRLLFQYRRDQDSR